MRRTVFLMFFFWTLLVSQVVSQNTTLFLVELAIMGKPEINLQGSDSSQRWQNIRADMAGLYIIKDIKALRALVKVGFYEEVEPDPHLRLDPRLGMHGKKLYLLPFAKEALGDLAKKFHRQFGRPLQINSALRTQEDQRSLARLVRVKKEGRVRYYPVNSNAAPIDGPKASAHMRGNTVDIARKTMQSSEQKWLEEVLLELESRDCLEATRENFQAVYHISFFPSCAVAVTRPDEAPSF